MGNAPDVLPWMADALGQFKAGNLAGALLGYRRVLSRDPDQPDAWCNVGAVLHRLGREDEALEACRRALELAPANPAAHATLGHVQVALGDLEASLASYHKALELDPGDLAATAGLASALGRLGRFEEALEADRRAAVLAPASAEAAMNLGYSLMRLGRLEEAEPRFQAALAAAPGFAKARWNLAYLRLLQGRYREAWPDFHARLQVPQGMDNLRSFRQPAWDGAPFPGRTLLVWVEQGLGDTLQFARYLPLAKARGGRVVFQTYRNLLGILEGLPGADALVPEVIEPPPFDLQAPLLELPALLESVPEAFPAPSPLGPPSGHAPGPGLEAKLQGPGRRIGLVWAGSPRHRDDARRSLDPALLAPLAGLGGVRWMSLQVGAASGPPLPGLVDLACDFRDFRDTAWALSRLDLLVTVDTAVAHLAGSMGLPTHLLLPFFPDWRWGFTGTSTPWYPSMRIHRQPSPGDWAAVVRGLAEHLG